MPVEPSGFATLMLPEVPLIANEETFPAFTPTSPVEPDMDWKLERKLPRFI